MADREDGTVVEADQLSKREVQQQRVPPWPLFQLDEATAHELALRLVPAHEYDDATGTIRPEAAARAHAKMLQLREALTRPPQLSTLRFNPARLTADAALQHVRQLLSDLNLQVECHQILPDAIAIASGPRRNPTYGYPEVTIDEACGEAVLRGADIFAVGVYGAQGSIRKGHRVSVVIDLYKQFNKGHLNVIPDPEKKIYIGNGVAQMDRLDFYKTQRGVGIKMDECIFAMPSLNGFMPNEFYPQNLPSMLVSHILDPQPGERVLDMCAAPGGKTTHIATLMHDQGTVIALDKNDKKAHTIRRLCKQLKLKCVSAIAANAAKALETLQAEEHGAASGTCAEGDSFRGFAAGSFDRVLLDAPCSGLGLRPRFRTELTLAHLDEMASYQRQLLSVGAALLKPGGTLVYSTCTVNPSENEGNVAWALQTIGELELAPQPPHFRMGNEGLAVMGLSAQHAQLVQRFDPCAPLDTNGFFIAKFIKRAATERR